MSLRNDWYVVALSDELGSEPLARRLFGERLVLFRRRDGGPAALLDRCVHRNVALSRGRVEDGCLQCPYHGWRFDDRGSCVEIPSLCEDEELPDRKVPTFPVREAGGLVWTCVGEEPVDFNPPLAPTEGGYSTFQTQITIACPMLWVIDNFVDTAHTGFVHAGLFRGQPDQQVTARIQETPTGVLIETLGEEDEDSLLGRLLVPRGETIQHTDEYLLPHTVRVDYRFGPKRHLVTVSNCTPVDDDTTRVYTTVSTRFPVISAAVSRVVRRMTDKILEQDRQILEDQAEQLRHFGGAEFVWTTPDEPCAFIARAYKLYENGRFPPKELREKQIEYLI